MTSPQQRSLDAASGAVYHFNWPFIVFALLVAALAVLVIFAGRKR